MRPAGFSTFLNMQKFTRDPWAVSGIIYTGLYIPPPHPNRLTNKHCENRTIYISCARAILTVPIYINIKRLGYKKRLGIILRGLRIVFEEARNVNHLRQGFEVGFPNLFVFAADPMRSVARDKVA